MGEVAVNGSNTPPTPTTDTVTIITQPEDTTAYVGGEFSFITVADTDDATATLSYQWQIDVDSTWTDISGATHATYVGTAPETTGTADYRCVVTSTGGGTATSDSATLTVEADTVTITAQPTTTSGYVGDTITLSVTAVSDNVSATLSYQWQVKNGSTYDDISGATSSTYTVPTTTAGTERYRVVVTSDKGGTATSNYADVTLSYQPMIIYCVGKSEYLTDGYNSTKGSIEGTTDIANAVPYYLIPTTNGYYIAKDDNGTLVYMYNDTSINIYSVNFTADASQADVVTLATRNNHTIITKYNEVKYFGYSGSGGGYRYYNSNTGGNYEFIITLVDGLTIVKQPQSTTILYGNSGTISVDAYGATTYQWQYYYADTWYDISGETSSTIIMSTDTDYYYIVRCVVSDGTTTIASDSANITIKDNLTVDIDTATTTAPTYSNGYKLPAVASTYIYAVSASVIPSKLISYEWTWENSGSYTTVVSLYGGTTDGVVLSLTQTDVPNNARAGTLICKVTTQDEYDTTGSTVTKRFNIYR